MTVLDSGLSWGSPSRPKYRGDTFINAYGASRIANNFTGIAGIGSIALIAVTQPLAGLEAESATQNQGVRRAAAPS